MPHSLSNVIPVHLLFLQHPFLLNISAPSINSASRSICRPCFGVPTHLVYSKRTATAKMSDTSWDTLSTRSLAPAPTKVRVAIKFGADSGIIVPVDPSTKISDLQIEAIRRAERLEIKIPIGELVLCVGSESGDVLFGDDAVEDCLDTSQATVVWIAKAQVSSFLFCTKDISNFDRKFPCPPITFDYLSKHPKVTFMSVGLHLAELSTSRLC
jgi:hypothetical protein